MAVAGKIEKKKKLPGFKQYWGSAKVKNQQSNRKNENEEKNIADNDPQEHVFKSWI